MPYGMEMTEAFGREWSLKWAEGVILGFAKGSMERARAFGMLRRAKKMGVKDEELTAIIQAIEVNPIYLPFMSQQEKAAKLSPIKEAMEKREI